MRWGRTGKRRLTTAWLALMAGCGPGTVGNGVAPTSWQAPASQPTRCMLSVRVSQQGSSVTVGFVIPVST